MFTPPKSKSPWEAMTSGSTGGWASGLKSWGPAITAAIGATTPINPLAPFMSAAMGGIGAGGIGGFQGTDKGWGNLGSTLLGGAAGWGLGGLGSGLQAGIASGMKTGLSGGIGNALSGVGKGFQQGLQNYWGATTGPFKSAANWLGNLGGTSSKASSLSGIGTNDILTKYLGQGPLGTGFGGMTGAGSGANAFFGGTGLGTGSTASALLGLSNNALSQGGVGPQWGGNVAANPVLAKSGAVSATGSGAIGAGTDFGSRVLGMLKDPYMLGGVALMGSGAFLNTPKAPEMPSYIGDLTAGLLGGSGLTDVGKMGRSELMKVMGQEGIYSPSTVSDPYYEAATRRVDEAYDKAEKDMVKRYKHYGGEESQDFNLALGKLRQDQAREKAAIGVELNERKWAAQLNRTYDAVKTAIGVDDNTMKDLLGLTQLSMEQAAMMYGIEVADVKSLREALGLGGSALVQYGMKENELAAQKDIYSNYFNSLGSIRALTE